MTMSEQLDSLFHPDGKPLRKDVEALEQTQLVDQLVKKLAKEQEKRAAIEKTLKKAIRKISEIETIDQEYMNVMGNEINTIKNAVIQLGEMVMHISEQVTVSPEKRKRKDELIGLEKEAMQKLIVALNQYEPYASQKKLGSRFGGGEKEWPRK